MAEQNHLIFRKEALDHISTPDQLSAYLRVTNPGIWLVLIAVLLLLLGMLAWSFVGNLETTVEARVIVEDRTARVITAGTETMEKGMTLLVNETEFLITSVSEDEFGRMIGTAEVTLPDGVYGGVVVVEQIRPIDFLLESR